MHGGHAACLRTALRAVGATPYQLPNLAAAVRCNALPAGVYTVLPRQY